MSTITKTPLFLHRRLVQATLVFSALVVMLLMIVSAQNGSFHPVTIGSGLALITSFYVLGEVIRSRFRITLRALLVAMFGICLCCALWGQTVIRRAHQRVAIDRLITAGGTPVLGVEGEGNWMVVDGGWILPSWVVQRLGLGTVTQVEAAEFNGESISAADIREIDASIFSNVSFYACDFEDGAAQALASLVGVSQLYVGRCRITDTEIEGIAQIDSLETLFIVADEQITDAGISHLKRLKSASRIQLAGLTGVTQEAIDELRNELPECNLGWTGRVPW